jgi:hypothetical protein
MTKESDIEAVLTAVAAARRRLGEHVKSGPRNASDTVN